MYENDCCLILWQPPAEVPPPDTFEDDVRYSLSMKPLIVPQLARALSLSAEEAEDEARRALQEDDDIAVAISRSLKEQRADRPASARTRPPPPAAVAGVGGVVAHAAAAVGPVATAAGPAATVIPRPDSVTTRPVAVANVHTALPPLPIPTIRPAPIPIPIAAVAAAPTALAVQPTGAAAWTPPILTPTPTPSSTHTPTPVPVAAALALAPVRAPRTEQPDAPPQDTVLAPASAGLLYDDKGDAELTEEQLQALSVAERRQYLNAVRDRLVNRRDVARQARLAHFDRPLDVDAPAPAAPTATAASAEHDEALEHRRRVAQRLREEVVDRPRRH